MLHISNNGFICMNRGDCFSVPLFINRGTVYAPVRYSLLDHPQATLYLGIMEPNQPFEIATVRKKYDSSDVNQYGDVMITFKTTDTACLLPGKYYYEVKLLKEDGNVETIVPKRDFLIID